MRIINISLLTLLAVMQYLCAADVKTILSSATSDAGKTVLLYSDGTYEMLSEATNKLAGLEGVESLPLPITKADWDAIKAIPLSFHLDGSDTFETKITLKAGQCLRIYPSPTFEYTDWEGDEHGHTDKSVLAIDELLVKTDNTAKPVSFAALSNGVLVGPGKVIFYMKESSKWHSKHGDFPIKVVAFSPKKK